MGYAHSMASNIRRENMKHYRLGTSKNSRSFVLVRSAPDGMILGDARWGSSDSSMQIIG